MHSFSTRGVAIATALLAAGAQALDGIVVPDVIAADTAFSATFSNGNSDQYRVYLAAALAGVNGPTCYLVNSTDLSSPVNLTIPASVGPSADYYSIGIADITSSQSATYSNRFNFTGGSGNYTEYESHLGGAPFWSAEDLPCSSYECARQCATASYPDDLTTSSAYQTMMTCILKCPGVTPAASQTKPANQNTTSSSDGSVATTTATRSAALITVASGVVLTAVETVLTSGGSTLTEALVGSMTLTLGGAEATISSAAVSLAQNGLDVGGSTTVAFSDMVQTVTTTATAAASSGGSASATNASAAATSSAAANRQEKALAGLAGVAGFAAFFL